LGATSTLEKDYHQAGWRRSGFSPLRAAWQALRRVLVSGLGPERVDRWLWNFGFFSLKARWFRFDITTPDGLKATLRPEDQCVVDEVYRDDIYADAKLAEDSMIVDCGAHVGLFTIHAAKRCPRGRVVAAEPSPLNLELLRRNVRQNNLANVRVLPWGLSGRAGEAGIHFTGEYSTDYLNEPVIGKASSFVVPVELHTLDEVYAAGGVERCDLLKMDIEGSELDTLRTGAKSLQATGQIIMEIHKRVVDAEEVLALLRGHGFATKLFRDSPDAVHAYAWRER